MTAIEQYQQRPTEVAIPPAAAGLVEWAQQADAAYRLAQKLVGTSFVPSQFKGKADEAAAAMLAGAEVGLSPMSSLRAFDVIQGVAAPRAITLRAIVQSQGHEMVVTEESPSKVVIRGRRRDSDEWQTVEWTIQRATQLGLTSKDQWKKQPQTMLVARATSDMARRLAADSILGIGYSAEETRDDIEPTQKVTRSPASRTVRRQERPTAPEPEFDAPPVSTPTADSEPAQEPVKATSERAEEPITPKQLTALNAALSSDLGLTEREDKLAYLSGELGREIASSKDVTKREAMSLLDGLARDRAADGPPEPPLDADWPDVQQPGGAR